MKMKKVLMFAAASMLLASCGGGGGRPSFGDNEYPVVTVGTSISGYHQGCAGCGDPSEGTGLYYAD